MAKQTQHHGLAWYVIHTYSGYEDNVARNLKQRIESMDMQDLIFDVMVLSHCNSAYMLKNWKSSKGARWEHRIMKFKRLFNRNVKIIYEA